MTGEEIVCITNNHAEECGTPPTIDTDDFDYVSYFENSHGDQSIFLYDSDEVEVTVYIADAGWENPQEVPGSWILENKIPPSEADMGILPDDAETEWLRACKSAVEPRISNDLGC